MVDAEYRAVEGYPLYEVNRAGTVRNKSTLKVLSIANPKGYPRMSMSRGKDRKLLYVHRLVATAFVPNDAPKTKTQVDHKDRDIRNFAADNLEWVTPSENSRRRRATGRDKRGRIVWQVDPETGKVVAEHCSLQAAARAVGLAKASSLHGAVDRPEASAGGFRWISTLPGAEDPGEWKTLANLDGEEFRYIVYEVSRDGRVRRKGGRILNPYLDANGYEAIQLRPRQGKTKTVRLSRLVAHVFVQRPPGDEALDVDHIDGDITNNGASNLQWLTKRAHAAKTNGKPVSQIDPGTGETVATHDTIKAAAATVGRKRHNLWVAMQGSNRTSGGFRWELAPSAEPTKKENILTDADVDELLADLLYILADADVEELLADLL